MSKRESLSKFRARICREHHLESLWLDRFDRGLIIDLIAVDPAYRGEGHGQRAMEALCEYADAHEISLALTVSDDFGSCPVRLGAWYESFGFRCTAGPQRYRMIRPPFAVPQSEVA